ncbi:hypothetical protein AB0I98_38600 [Streptomyces sp. NPDC050211]
MRGFDELVVWSQPPSGNVSQLFQVMVFSTSSATTSTRSMASM